jgi:hypothetical protein
MQKIQCKKRNTNFIDYVGFLIDLKNEAITKIANKTQQYPGEITHKKNILEFL